MVNTCVRDVLSVLLHLQVNHYPTPNTQYNVTGLTEGNRYEFRVVAVNEAGPGKPSKPSNSITAKVPKCEYESSPSS